VESKRALARAIVARFHGEDAAAEAEAHFNRLHVERALPDEIEEAELPDADPVHLPALLREHFGVSSSEARRLLAGGGVRLDGEQLGSGDLDLPAERLEGRVLQVGKRRHKRFRANGSPAG
jgi:tyrosyl-tRNA synthetase